MNPGFCLILKVAHHLRQTKGEQKGSPVSVLFQYCGTLPEPLHILSFLPIVTLEHMELCAAQDNQ